MSPNLDASAAPVTPRSRRRTIIYIGQFEFSNRNAAAQRAIANALILKEIGYRVVLFGVSRDLPANADHERVDLGDAPFDCWELPYPASHLAWLRRITTIGDITRVIEAHYADDLAAVIFCDMSSIVQVRLKSYFHRHGALAITEVSEWYGASRMRNVASVVKNIDRPIRMRWVNARVDGAITCSAFLSDFYRKAGIPVVEVPTLVPDEPAVTKAAPATPDGEPKRLLFAGTGFDPSQVALNKEGLKDRLDKVIAALHVARRLGADFRLDVYGADRADYLAIVPGQASMLAELGDRIAFHGLQPRQLVRAKLAEADYSIFLRKKNIVTLAGFPSKFSESVYLGTPVITNAVGSIVSYHVEGYTGHYIDYDDSKVAGQQLAGILRQGAAQVNAMKQHCRSSGLFHYRRYVKPVEQFMAVLGAAS